MQIDNNQIMPDEKTRHWMVAQSHVYMNEMDEEGMTARELSEQMADPNHPRKYQ